MEFQMGKYLSDTFAIWSGLNQGNALLLLLFSFALECAIRKSGVNQEKWDMPVCGIC
jgi:hypothetical protein